MIPKYPPPFVIHETCLASFSFGVSAKTDFKGNDCPDKIFQAKIRNNFLFYFGIRNSLDIFFQHKLVRLTRPHSPLGGGITVVKSVDSTPSLGTSEITTQFLFGSNPIL